MRVKHERATEKWLLSPSEVAEKCRRQRAALMCEREQISLSLELRNARARLQLRKAFRNEIDAAVRPLVESALLN